MSDTHELLKLKAEGLHEWQIELYEQELRFCYVNARYTSKACGGHGKAHQNELIAEKYKEKIKEFGGRVPTEKEVNRWGKFNGEGSY
jgi:hypothetical protein